MQEWLPVAVAMCLQEFHGIDGSGYKPEEVVVFGVFLHGLTGDLASGKVSMEALVASDII